MSAPVDKPVDEETGHLAWCRGLMENLAEGGTWGIPRSGLIFIRRGNALVLTQRMPHHESMPLSPAKLKEFQQDDFDLCKAKFAAAGYEVRDESTVKE